MPDSKRGKGIAILQMEQDGLQKNSGNTEPRYVRNDQAVFAHSGLVVARS
jgi:hypothetical protein